MEAFVTENYGNFHLETQKVKTEFKKINTEIGSLKRKISKLEKRKKVLSEVLTKIK